MDNLNQPVSFLVSSFHNYRNEIGFWCLGLFNNMSYVIMIAGADNISSGGVGLVYVFDILPTLFIKLTLPYWFHLMSYHVRIRLCSLFMLLSFLSVAANKDVSLSWSLLGVAFTGIQSGLGEASILALTTHYSSQQQSVLNAWSSGTGCAGICGYLWIILCQAELHLSLGTTLRLAALVLPASFSLVYRYVLQRPLTTYVSLPTTTCDLKPDDPIPTTVVKTSFGAKVAQMRQLWWPYMMPLLVVYFAEYCLQAGVWPTIGIPDVRERADRERFYTWAGTSYQIGVFISRSSGMFFRPNHLLLERLPCVQLGFLVFFIFVSITHWFDSWALLVPCGFVGLFGGAVYVHAFRLIAQDVPHPWKEFALSAVSVADTLGIVLADVTGLAVQGCLYSVNHIPGATFPIQC